MRTRYSDENSVRLCVCVRLSVKSVHCDKTEERSVQIFIPYERSLSLVFWEEWLVGATPSTWNFGLTGPRWSEIADFQPIFARSASVVTPSDNTNRKSTTRFRLSLNWSSSVAPKPPKGAKTQNGRFRSKITPRLKTVCYKVSLRENCQRHICKAFIGISIRAKKLAWTFHSKWTYSGLTQSLANRRFSIYFRCSTSAVRPCKKFS